MLLPLVLVPVLGGAAFLLDGPLYRVIRGLRPSSGDFRRELETLGQFGSLSTFLIFGAVVLLLDRGRLRRLLDWALAIGMGTLIFGAIKVLLGRARPEFNQPDLFLGPFGTYEDTNGETLSALAGASQLHAMPSSHTTHAVIAAVFIGTMYPKLRPLVYAWAGVVALLRVLHGAHWPSDVVVGALLAIPLAHIIVTRYWGVRGLDWVWQRLIDRRSNPAFPALLVHEEHSAR